MNTIVDISHPAHLHFFKYAIDLWKQHGHRVQIVARDKDIVLPLLDEYGYTYVCLSRARRGAIGLALELVEHESRLFGIARRLRPDIILNVGGTFITHIGKLLGTRTIVFTDTEHARLSNAIAFPFATWICTPACYKMDLGNKHVRYDGYHELAYLHPDYFAPDPAVLEEAGIKPNQRFFLTRFVSWGAAHDVGYAGFSLEGKRELVRRLSGIGQVIVTAESPLPADLEPYRMAISPTKIHDLLYYSSLYIGEGATMASEAAILGTPSIYVNPLTAGTLEEIAGYGLMHRITDERQGIELALTLASDVTTQEVYQAKRRSLLENKIDVTAWVVDFVEKCANEPDEPIS
jgi:predicted glycosyltransferase